VPFDKFAKRSDVALTRQGQEDFLAAIFSCYVGWRVWLRHSELGNRDGRECCCFRYDILARIWALIEYSQHADFKGMLNTNLLTAIISL
jgi:hypothetical protein